MNSAELIYQDNYIKICNFNYEQEDLYYNNTSFDLEVRSGAFCGVAPCEYDIKEFRVFVRDLSQMYDFKKQSVILSEICYGSSVKFEADKVGHIEVSGEIFGVGMDHSLKFSFVLDQFVLGQFISELNKLIDA